MHALLFDDTLNKGGFQMIGRIVTLTFILIGGSIGFGFMPELWTLFPAVPNVVNNPIVNSAIGSLVFYVISLPASKYIEKGVMKLESVLSEKSTLSLLFGTAGTIIGLILSWLINIALIAFDIPIISTVVPIIVTVGLGFMGYRLATGRTEELQKLFSTMNQKQDVEKNQDVLERYANDNFRRYKILDTSVIIDGRIYDIVRTGFLEGTLLIPQFVLHELQHIADSSDSLKRVRGRRGLDILNALQKEPEISVEMYEGEIEEIFEVDAKLVQLAKWTDGVVVTNDYNLNKVCEFQNVPVLNINELANAVKPIVIPGEPMRVVIVKSGTERSQGVAYLDDGTMVVVEEGQHFMNQTLDIVVTSSLQTAAGRMIFAKPAHSQKALNEKESTK